MMIHFSMRQRSVEAQGSVETHNVPLSPYWIEQAVVPCGALWKWQCDTMTDRVLSLSVSRCWPAAGCVHSPKREELKTCLAPLIYSSVGEITLLLQWRQTDSVAINTFCFRAWAFVLYVDFIKIVFVTRLVALLLGWHCGSVLFGQGCNISTTIRWIDLKCNVM